ncbi:nicotinamide riboside transporter PnuC [Chitinibacter sp. ZOR0017]|uniref:nicotinamide riboside transporter PnuC n=1 Tax=Chitinibacter sp. ZOR0017 TaxID=1339254 RepID=UPI0006463316|nr:nicotinamide riboside transporter PnuC [Chitinibacter sp. ZOR0017]
MTALEIIGFALTILAIALAARSHVLTWPLQLVASVLYVWLFAQFNLFGEATLQAVYAVLAVYGWLQWRQRRLDATTVVKLPVQRLSRNEWWLINGVGVLATAAVANLQIHFLPTDVPVLDSAIFVFGLLAQWMQATKRLENWPYWIVLNLLASGVYFYKSLHITGVLYLLLAGLAVWGWRNWQRELAAA